MHNINFPTKGGSNTNEFLKIPTEVIQVKSQIGQEPFVNYCVYTLTQRETIDTMSIHIFIIAIPFKFLSFSFFPFFFLFSLSQASVILNRSTIARRMRFYIVEGQLWKSSFEYKDC